MTAVDRLRGATVLRVAEEACEVIAAGASQRVAFAPPFPSPAARAPVTGPPRRRRFAPGLQRRGGVGADWWVAGPVVERPGDAEVEFDEVARLYTDNGLWDAAFGR